MSSQTNHRAIVLGITSNWAFAAATVLMGIIDNYTHIDETDIIIIHDGVDDASQKMLNKILPCTFIYFDQFVPDNIRESRGTHMKFSRLLCFQLLDQYDKVLWLDTDILILDNIDVLFDYGKNGLAMMPHDKKFPQIYNKTYLALKDHEIYGKYNYDVQVNNTGVMVFTNKLPNPKMLQEWCFNTMVELSDVNVSIQPVITFMIQEFNIDFDIIPKRYNNLPHVDPNMALIHTWGDNKYWNTLNHPVWNRYYLNWLKIGGNGPLTKLEVSNRNKQYYISRIKQIWIFKIFLDIKHKLSKL